MTAFAGCVRSELLSRAPVPVPGRFGLPLGVALTMIVTAAAVAIGATGHPERAVIALAVTVALTASVTTAAATLGTAVVGWFLLAGFVVGREGQVGLTAQSGRAAVVLAVVAIGCAGVVAAARWAWPRMLRAAADAAKAPQPRQPSQPSVSADASGVRVREPRWSTDARRAR